MRPLVQRAGLGGRALFFSFFFLLIDGCLPLQLVLLHLLEQKVTQLYQLHKKANVEFDDIMIMFFFPEVLSCAHTHTHTQTWGGDSQ